MRDPRKRQRRAVVRFFVFFVGGALLGALANPRKQDSGNAATTNIAEPYAPLPAHESRRNRAPRRFGTRLAFTTVFVVLFVAGGAFTAFGGDQVAKLVEAENAGQSLDTSTDGAVATESAPADPAAEAAPAEPAPAPEAAPADPAPAPEAEAAPAPEAAPAADDPAAAAVVDAQTVTADAAPVADDTAPAKPRKSAPAKRRAASLRKSENPAAAKVITIVAREEDHADHVEHTLVAKKPELDAEAHTPFSASIVWLNQATPDPTPPSKRLLRSFGKMLVHTSQDAGADWSLVYGILRADGADGRVLATDETVKALADRLVELKKDGRDDWQSAAAVLGDTSLADRAVALGHYAHAVGLETLIRGLDASKERLTRRLLNDPRAWVYDAGRGDLEAGHVDVRVIAVISYLADTFDSVSVSCLISGHRLYARPGVISRHIFGEAVDVAALGGLSILGHQEPGGVTEKAVRALLLLPAEMEPQQIISLLGLGGPSFPLANHDDHIHVGY